jgi:hypothetical protein
VKKQNSELNLKEPRIMKPSRKLLAALLLMLLPAVTQAQFTFTINNGTITITGYTGPSGPVSIPSTISGLQVTAISRTTFAPPNNVGNISSISIPDTVTNIDSDSFVNCYALTTIIIDAANPAYSSDGDVFFNKSQTMLLQYPRAKTGDSFGVPSTVTNIGPTAFFCCSLKSISIPATVTAIALGAFRDCSGLTNIAVDAANAFYRSKGGILFDQNQTSIICFPGGLGGAYAIPSSITNIATYAFEGCQITNVTIPDSVCAIEDVAFGNCWHLVNITIPGSVRSVGSEAFYMCLLRGIYFEGNEPSGRYSEIFDQVPGTVYYLPKTIGWTNVYGGLHTALWNPQALTGRDSFGVRTNRFGFNITGTTNIPIVVEACTNLGSDWIPLQSVSLTNGSFYFSDPQWTNYPGRFYRFRSP